MSTTARFALLPRDGLFCKDGRGWYTSDVGRSHSHPWPPPSTIRGALRAAWGQSLMARSSRTLSPAQWERETQDVALGPVLALLRPLGEDFAPEHRMWPVPADALAVDGRLQRLLPRRPTRGVATLGTEDDAALEALWRPVLPPGKPRSLQPFWTEDALSGWLRGETPKSRGQSGPPFRVDVRVTLNIDTQTAEPGMLYQTPILEMLCREPLGTGAREWALGLECTLPADAPDFPGGPLGLGGKRRLTLAERVTPALFAAPRGLPERSPGLRLILATPAQFQRGWLPDGLERAEYQGDPAWVGTLPGVEGQVVLRAALVNRPLELSTWDMVQRRARATRRLVPAGSVYFFERVDGRPFTALSTLWLAPWGNGREEGLGRVLPGHWNPEEMNT
ncbi:CRISPR-associated protein Crm3 [Archangium violaceum]|uniref:type III-B CRISPR module-associated Cmr3 family protein n=1 Tax=Archangium violaceum TaxID=83451 RepID=UPI00194FC2C2|nr:type III-B CRISPR module-associated Cmr3 family protein [Archangium violaceum]QRN96598.1 CRISPR-associated protein Crm3 [Archangium violaceum]